MTETGGKKKGEITHKFTVNYTDLLIYVSA